MHPYSLDLRTRVAACQESGAKKAAVARRFGVSRSFVKDLMRRQAATGALAPKPATSTRRRRLGWWLTYSSTRTPRWPR